MTRPPEFVRFRDLEPDLLNVEYQVHTDRTDGEASVADVLDAAEEKELAAVAFTEHVRRDTAWFPDFARQVRERAERHPELRVYVGCEAKALDDRGSLDASEDVLDLCDVVLGSVHRFPDGRGGVLEFSDVDPERFARMEADLAIGLLRTAPIHVLAHPGGMYQRRFGAYPDYLFREMMEASLERGVAIEINSSYLVDFDAFLRLCDEVNPYVSIGSDAHRLAELGACRDILRGTPGFAR